MQQGLILQRLVEKPPNWNLWMAIPIAWVGFVLILSLFSPPFFDSDPDFFLGILVYPLFLYFGLLAYVAGRFNSKKKCVMLEAMGEYEKAMLLATKYAGPELITLFRQRYASQLAQKNNIQPTQSNDSEQSASVINIHNVQTQQGPTEINVQDSVVTDWNQR